MSKTRARAFNLLGNIAVVNFPRKFRVKDKKKFAEEILKSNKSIRTVLEKKGKIKGRLRKISTQWIAGEKTKEALYKENGCVFRFNVDTTYFSPRLSNERKEIASLIRKTDSVLVMFAGVAPLPIVIAKHSGARIFSNEINRDANKYGRLNAELNKLKNKVIFLDGDIKRIVKKIISSFHRPSLAHPPRRNQNNVNVENMTESIIPRYFDFIIMPRPQLKDSFLEQAFYLSKKGTKIYYYDFCRVGEEKEIVEKIKHEAGKFKKKIKILNIKHAGEIAPYKIRLRVDFVVL